MKNNLKKFPGLLGILSLTFCALFLQSSCTVVPDVNQVGSSYSAKTQFQGDWYYRPTMVDKQFHNSSMFVGLECNLDRVKFDITEDTLRAYRSYEKVPGTEIVEPGTQTLVAAFAIDKHFDIRRQYNTVNGVENNVIEENDVDRPWSEREYIRVDWSNNLVPDAGCNDWIKTQTSMQVPRGASGDFRQPYRVRVTPDYMETTVEALASPQESTCKSIGDWHCESAQVKMKFSFAKIKKNDYQPQSYPDYKPLIYGKTKENTLCTEGDEGCENLKELWLSSGASGAEICNPGRHNIDSCKQYEVPVFSRFGYFRTERHHFDRESDFTLSGREQFINRWNMWQQTKHEDGTIIPVEAREPKPIVYYLNVQFPPDLYDASQTIAREWSVAFSSTAAELKSECTLSAFNEYVRTHKLKKAMSERGYKVATEVNIDEACRVLGEYTRVNNMTPMFFSGDHNQINDVYGQLFQIRKNDCNEANVFQFIKKNNLAKEWSEQQVGDISVENLEEACAVLERISEDKNLKEPFRWQQLGDLRYSMLNYTRKAELSGPLGYGPSSADPLTGEIINGNANIYGSTVDVYASWGADFVQVLNGEASADEIKNGSLIREYISRNKKENAPASVSDEEVRHFDDLFQDRTSRLSDQEYFVKIPLTSIGGNWDLIKESGIEQQYLVTDEMLRLFSGESSKVLADNIIENAMPSSWYKMSGASFTLQGKRGVPNAANSFVSFENKVDFFGQRNACFLAETVEPAVADLAAQLKGKSWDEAYRFIRENIFISVTLHEIGHTLGLRHNFEGSADALNFFPDFWAVKTNNHLATDLTKHSHEMRYSSIMDYHQRFNSDFAGLGLYDKAAIKFGYGGLIEVFDETEGNFVPKDWHANTSLFHYKDLPYLFSGDDVDEKLNEHHLSVKNKFKAGDHSARIDVQSLGIEPHAENLFRRKNVKFDDYYQSLIPRLLGASSSAKKSIYYEVPFRYCSDRYAGVALGCDRWDMGASAEEIVDNAAQMYDAYYLFNNFRGDKIHFSASGYMSKLYSRTYLPMLTPFQRYYSSRRSSMQIWPQMSDWAKASIKGLNFFGKVLQMVEPGDYCLNENNVYVPEAEVESCANKVEIGIDQGRYYDTKFSQNFFFKPDSIGHMYDKLLAMQALTDSVSSVSRDFSVSLNRGAHSIGYYRAFAPEMIQLFTGILKADTFSYSPEILLEDDKPVVKYRPLVDLSPLSASATEDSPLRIKASNSWVMRYYALLFPMVNYTNNADRQLDFAKRARITLVGSKHDPVVDNKIEQMVFVDPVTNMQYRSLAPQGDAMAPGYQLLKEAQKLVSDGKDGSVVGPWYEAKRKFDKAKIAKNGVTLSSTSEVKRAADENFDKAEVEMHALNSKLNQQVQLIDLVRYLGDLLDYGG